MSKAKKSTLNWQLEKLAVQPGEILILKVPMGASPDDIVASHHGIMRALKKAGLPDNTPVMALPKNLELGPMDEGDAQTLREVLRRYEDIRPRIVTAEAH